MTLTEKVAYLKGLAAGLDLDKDTKEADLVDAIDEDLDELEEYIFDDEDFDDDCDCCCCDDEELYEVECPLCGEEILLDDEMLDEEIIECPGCGEKLELDIDFDDCECDCDCGCDCCDED